MLYETFETRFYTLPTWKQCPARTLRERFARLVFKDAYEALGSNMRFMVTGMAPIKRSTLDFFKLMQLPLFETYGMTEFGGITLNLPGASKLGSVGRPL